MIWSIEILPVPSKLGTWFGLPFAWEVKRQKLEATMFIFVKGTSRCFEIRNNFGLDDVAWSLKIKKQ